MIQHWINHARNRFFFVFVFLMILGMAGCTALNALLPAPTLVNQYGTPIPPVPTLDASQVARGKQIYQAQCARCHGENGVGDPNWKVPDKDLIFPPPPHNDAGHSWHHPDRVLFEAIRDGLRDPLKPNSELRMPPFGGVLSEAEMRSLIEYFKSLWNSEHREFQWTRTSEDVTPTPTALP